MVRAREDRLTAEDVRLAGDRIRGHVRRTPVLALEPEALGLTQPVRAKLESLQVTGTFKVRNAVALLQGAEVPAAGVVAASGGNFGLALAHAARRLGHRLAVAVPEAAPEVKVAAIREQGATVERVPGAPAHAFARAEQWAQQTGAVLAHPYDRREVAAGAGTCALELDEQCPDLDTVLVAVGGGGLVAGTARWFGRRVRVVAVETTGTPTLHAALAAGEPVPVEASGVGLSALGAPVIGAIAWEARDVIDDSVLVSDEAVIDAQRRLWQVARVGAEPGGAVAVAALTSGVYRPEAGERVAVIVCGGNVDPATLVAGP